MSAERQGCLRSSWWSWRAIGRTELGLNVSRAMVMADMADNRTSKDVGTKEKEEDAAKFALSLAERGSGLDRKLVFQHSHRQCCLISSPKFCIASHLAKHTIMTTVIQQKTAGRTEIEEEKPAIDPTSGS